MHQESIGLISRQVDKLLQKHTEFFRVDNEIKVINEHGYKAIFGKQPDAGFNIAPEIRQDRKQPSLILEVAVNHESLGILTSFISKVRIFILSQMYR